MLVVVASLSLFDWAGALTVIRHKNSVRMRNFVRGNTSKIIRRQEENLEGYLLAFPNTGGLPVSRQTLSAKRRTSKKAQATLLGDLSRSISCNVTITVRLNGVKKRLLSH